MSCAVDILGWGEDPGEAAGVRSAGQRCRRVHWGVDMRHGGLARLALVVALVLVADASGRAVLSSADSPLSPQAVVQSCRVSAPSDPAVWERGLPIADVSSALKATDAGCVSEVSRTANTVVWRGPSGRLTGRVFSGPVNYRAGDGSWRAIDTRLVADGTGGTVNKAGPFAVRFGADASSGSLVRVASGDVSLSFGFEGQAQAGGSGLVAPAKSVGVVGAGDASDSISFGGVLANTDLRYRLAAGELKEAVVLNGPLAPGGLPEFRFSLNTQGLRAETTGDGTIRFLNQASGAPVFTVPVGVAFDAGAKPATSPAAVKLVPSADPNVSGLVVSVDGAWLSDPGRVFPVTIDPSLTTVDALDTFVSSAAPNTNFLITGQFDPTTGLYYDKVGKDTATGAVYRSLQSFDLSAFTGAYIVSASWNGYAYSTAGTTPVGLTLRPPSAAWDASLVTWNTQPALRTASATSGGYSGAGWQSATVTSWVQNWASGTWANYGIELLGPTAGLANLAAWFNDPAHASYLDVTYDAYPQATYVNAGGQFVGSIAKTSTPTLSAQIDDSDTQSGLYAHFTVYNSAKTLVVWSGDGSHVSSGGRSAWASPSLADGTYWYLVQARDGTAQKIYWVWFPLTVDTAAPNTPTGGLSGVSANSWTTGGGSATVQLDGNGSTDVQGFFWGLDEGENPTEYEVATANAASFPVTPTWGWHDLVVRSVDKAGNVSGAASHFTFGWGTGGFAYPPTGLSTQKRVTVQVNSTTAYEGITLQWRRAEVDAWQDVPAGDVTHQSTGAGIGAWPVTVTPGTSRSAFPALVWDAASTAGGVDGPLQLRAAFLTGGVIQGYLTDVASVPNLTLDQSAFGAGFASAPAGPGQVNLLTGNLELSATDVALPAGTVSRTFQSRAPNAPGSVFGPGWSLNIGTAPSVYRSLTDNGDTVVITAADGSLFTFRKQTDGSYVAEDDLTGLALTKVSSTRFELKELSFVTSGFTNYANPSSPNTFLPSDVDMSDGNGQSSASWLVVDGVAEPTKLVAAPAPGVSCATSPETTRGCLTLTFDYAPTTTATGTSEPQWGDYLGRLKTVHAIGWDPDPSTQAMRTVDVASYTYDSTGRLRAAWDPRVSPALKTKYSYDSDGHVVTVTPPGEQAWTYSYAPLSGEPAGTGRLTSVSRPALPSGTATETFVYRIPLTTAAGGPYDMDSSTVARWAQTDLPTDATAVYPPDQVPSGTPPTGYERATVYYLNAQAQLVNVAQPGGNIATSEHDTAGRVVRVLSAANRQQALDSGTDTPTRAAAAQLLDSQSIYDSTGRPVDSYGPAHPIALPDGTQRSARAHAHSVYDEGSPNGTAYNLVTTQTVAAAPTDGTAEQDSRTTKSAYAIGTDTSGWTLGTPLQTIVDPGASPHLNLTTTTLYDVTTGQMTERRLPANPAGSDAHATKFIAYTAGTNPADNACGNRPEWATLPCKQLPAAQPGTPGIPNLPTSQVTKYNLYQQPEQSIDTNGTTNRTTTIAYNAAGRQTSQDVESTIGTDIPPVTSSYDTATGRPTTTSDGTRTLTRGYDTLGRLTSYTDGDGNTTQYTYDLLDRPSTINDGKATTTYTYDGGTERRGLPTTITDSAVGSFTATYDRNGQLATQTYPGGLTATNTYDTAGQATDLAYTKGSGLWPHALAVYNIHGEKTHATSSLFTYDYSYDTAGRLTDSYERNIYGCRDRQYGFDADTNRTTLSTGASQSQVVSDTTCPPPSGSYTTTTSSYDAADRITTSGYGYDAFGRTTTIPATDSPSTHTTTTSYYNNDLVNTLTANGATLTYNLDPGRRVRTWTSTADNQTHTHHYTSDTDSPAWTTENTAGTTWTRYLPAFNGLAATQTNGGTINLQLIDLHGDIITTALPTDTTSTFAGVTTNEYGQARTWAPATGSRYDHLGAHQRQRDTNSGIQLMGVRLYNPNTGRFLQTDPILGGSANNYEYTGGDPINRSDISGAHWKCIDDGPPHTVYVGVACPYTTAWTAEMGPSLCLGMCAVVMPAHFNLIQYRFNARAVQGFGTLKYAVGDHEMAVAIWNLSWVGTTVGLNAAHQAQALKGTLVLWWAEEPGSICGLSMCQTFMPWFYLKIKFRYRSDYCPVSHSCRWWWL